MRNSRTLSLKRETLSELTNADLAGINGGQILTHLTCNPTYTCGHGPSFDEPCPTLPIYNCFVLPRTITCR